MLPNPPKTNRTCSFPFLFISSVSRNHLSLLRRYSLPLSLSCFPSFYLIPYSLILSFCLSSFLPYQVYEIHDSLAYYCKVILPFS
uniref:Uncharacterized protein n=1 Tax=Sander lucioperca TaxID=283035 RepID=A0A8D0AG46_SANLU